MPGTGDTAQSYQIQNVVEQSLAARAHTIWVGFGLVLMLMASGAVYSYVSVRSLQANNARVRSLARERDQLLGGLVNDILRTSTLARDYLSDPNDSRADIERERLEDARARMYQNLSDYDARSPATQQSSLTAVRADIDDFWAVVEPSLHWGPKLRRENAANYLVEHILPKSEKLEQLATDITYRNEQEVDEAERQLEAHYLDLQEEMLLASSLAIVLGFGAAFLSIRRIQRLEREAETRYHQVVQARQQLSDLSGQLVMAQEEERRKLSRELHDQLGQTMAALVTELGRLEHDPSLSKTAHERATIARQLAEDNVRTVRDTALLLRPSMLDDLGLIPALRWQAREVRRRSDLKVRVLADETCDQLPDDYKTCIFRVIQEALHNCIKHAKATEARVVLQQTPEGLSVSVQDDGTGFDTSQDRGLGMLGMEERVSRLGGLLRVQSEPGHGTVLSILFPDVHCHTGEGQLESSE